MEADTAFMIQNFGAGRGIEEVKATAADIFVGEGSNLTIDLGGVIVDTHDFDFAKQAAIYS